MNAPPNSSPSGALLEVLKQPDPAWSRWPYCNEKMVQAVSRVLRSGKLNYWTGTEGKQFEEEFADFVGTQHAIAVANGTVGLELALVVLGIGPGDEVIVPSRTFVATASAVVMRGATPVCADVDPESQNITADTIRPHLTARTRAIIPVHLAGWPCDMEPILKLARQHDLRVVEDCAQAHGAQYHGRHVGSLGDIGVFSFCQDKIMTTGGEGGMVVTNSQQLWSKAWSFKDHGKCYDAVHNQSHPPGFRWLHKSFGTNWRMTEMQAAFGRVALKELPRWVELRRRNAAILYEHIAKIPLLRTPVPSSDFFHSYYKFYTFVRPQELRVGWDRDRIMQEINALEIPCFSGSCSEIYLEEAFRRNNGKQSLLEQRAMAHDLGETSLMFLVHPTLEETVMRQAGEIIAEILRQASATGGNLNHHLVAC